MINSNYNTKNQIDPTIDLKKKFSKPKVNDIAPSTEEIDSMFKEISPNNSNNLQKEKRTDAITGGNYEVDSSEKKIIAPEKGEAKNPDDKLSAVGLGAMDMAATAMAQKGPMNRAERTSMTMNLATKGASAGSAFGPMGTAVGALAGLGTGLILGIGDQKKLDKKAETEKLAMLDNVANDRMKSQKLEEGKKIVAKNKALLESQMGMLGSNYSQTKTT